MSKIIEHNIETGEITERDMTPEELAQQAAEIEAKAQAEAEAQSKAAARQAILDRLGLTEEEARLLLG
jgi:hypothetical protein